MNQTPKGEARTDLMCEAEWLIRNGPGGDGAYDERVSEWLTALAQSRTPEPPSGWELAALPGGALVHMKELAPGVYQLFRRVDPAGAVAEAAQPEPAPNLGWGEGQLRTPGMERASRGDPTERSREAVQRAAGEGSAIERCRCGYPMPCALTVPIGFCRSTAASETPPEALRPDGKERRALKNAKGPCIGPVGRTCVLKR